MKQIDEARREHRRGNEILLGDMGRLGGPWGECATNDDFLQELLRAVRHAARSELTQRQRKCFTLYFEEGLTVRQIARQLELCDSTVSRHLAAASEKVRRHAGYCVFGRAPGGREGERRFLEGS